MAIKFRSLIIFASELKSSRNGMTKKEMLKRCQELGLLGRGSIRTIDRWIEELKLNFNFEITSHLYADDKNQRRYKVTNFPNEIFSLSQEERTGLEILKESLSDENHKLIQKITNFCNDANNNKNWTSFNKTESGMEHQFKLVGWD